MARNRDRQFSEGENLKYRMDREAAQAEDRLPRWAAEREERAEERPSYWGEYSESSDAFPQQEEIQQPQGLFTAESPVRQGRRGASPARFADDPREESPAEEAQDAENGETDTADTEEREADAAWDRAARRVESSQSLYPPQEEGEDAPLDAEIRRTPRRKGPPRPPAPSAAKKKKKKDDEDERGSFLKKLVIAGVCVFFFLMVALMVLSNFVDHPLLALPRKMVTAVVTPVQKFFSDATDSVVGYLRRLKVRDNIENEYDKLLIQLDQLSSVEAQLAELQYENEQLRDLLDEHANHDQFNPIAATVIGNDSGNYFATLTLNVGANDGVEEYMAVVSKGGLVGVTYDVEDNKCQVRCIINTDSTVAALVQSSRDQGSVKGTLGTNGEPMCRMYYLPENSLPRPGDMVVTSGVGLEFPKGIPIGYIRESTRGMDENKSYVVLEPVVDFQHLEYVTVYRYKPAYAEKAQVREDKQNIQLQTLPTVRPVPTFSLGGVSDFLFGATATPGPGDAAGQSPAPSATPTAPPAPTATPDPNATPVPDNLEYVPNLPSGVTPSPTPRPTPSPTPTAVPTQDPSGMTMEEEE
ncbi:MAG: rod shape-determining protein MreC [Clostridiales bacterium]|nr:rod shape-determining protein MreC [Clostridiales bacterium]